MNHELHTCKIYMNEDTMHQSTTTHITLFRHPDCKVHLPAKSYTSDTSGIPTSDILPAAEHYQRMHSVFISTHNE